MTKTNGKWIRLGKAIATLAVAIGALGTAITGHLAASDAKDGIRDVGRLASDLATNPEADAVYEALVERSRFLERQIESLQRRVDDLHRPRWDPHTMGPPEGDPTPKVRDKPRIKRPKKAADLPRIKKARAGRARMIKQVQQLQGDGW